MPSAKNIASYSEALALYERADERKKGTSAAGERKLPGHKTNFTGISKYGDDIAFVYHSTDVVRWRPDNTCTVDLSYKSASTCVFADRFSPWRVRFEREGAIVRANDHRYYKVGGSGKVRLNADGLLTHPREDTEPFVQTTVNRERAKVASDKTNLTAFLKWYRMMTQMRGYSSHKGPWPTGYEGFEQSLANDTLWGDLLNSAIFGYGISPVRFIQQARTRVYVEYECYDKIPHDFATTYYQASKWI